VSHSPLALGGPSSASMLLFEIERGINGKSADERRAIRQELRPWPPGRWTRSLDARGAAAALAQQRCGEGHGLYAEALAGLHALPR